MYIFLFVAFAPLVGTTVAGNSNGNSGSGSTYLNNPHGLFLTSNGTLYVVDTDNARVQAFSPNSTTGSTVVPNSVLSYPEFIYVNQNTSSIYVADYSWNQAIIYPGSSTIPIVSSNLTCASNLLSSPTGIVVDNKGNVYMSSSDCHQVLKWSGTNANSSIRVAGTGISGSNSSQLNTPYGLALDQSNSILYVADRYNHRIQKIFLNSNSTVGITVAGGNGAGTNLNQLDSPYGIAVSQKDGSIYIADTYNNRIVHWKVNATKGIVIAGSASGASGTTSTLLDYPIDLKLDATEQFLYVCDSYNSRVQRYQLY